MHKQPLFILCICFILGIIIQEYLSLRPATAYILLLTAIVPLLSYASRSLFWIGLRKYFLGFFFAVLGLLMHAEYSKNAELPEISRKQEVIFKLNKKLNSNEKNRRYEITARPEKGEFRTVLSIPRTLPELDYKHLYKAELYINKVSPPKNDYQFDYSKYLRRNGIYHQSYLPGKMEAADAPELSLSDHIRQKRLEVLQKIDSTSISPKSREFLKGIILADRTEMDRETVADFTNTGLVHILAISGSHIVIIFGIFYFLLVRAFPLGYRRLAIVCSLALIWIFAVFIGYGNSVVRSCIMITAYFVYIILQRKPDLLHSMALAAFIILLADSNQLFDVGFQLSFMAVFGIYWLNQPILKHLPPADNFAKKILFNTFSLSLAAQISTLPAVIYYFHQFSVISIVANLVIIPLSEIIIVFSLLMTVLLGTGIYLNQILYLYDGFIQFILAVIHWFSGFEGLLHTNIPMTLVEVIILCTGIYYLRFLTVRFNIRNLLPLLAVATIYAGVHLGLTYYHERQHEIMIHEHFRERYFSVKRGSEVEFWISMDADLEKVKKYIIDPYLTSRRTASYRIKTIPAGANSVSYKGITYPLK